MTTDYEKFVKHMQELDSRRTPEGRKVSVGQKDEKGSLLILGGHKVDLWQLKNGLYSVAGEVTAEAEKAIESYNLYNSTKLKLDYIWEVFKPWYNEQNVIVAQVPSKSDPSRTYTVRRNPSGEYTCECLGFRFRGDCWHTQATKELSNGQG